MTDDTTPSEGSEQRLLRDAYRRGRAEPIARDKDGSTVLSVRLPRDILRELTRVAKSLDRPVGRVARELIETGLASHEGTAASVVWRAASRLVHGEQVRTPSAGLITVYISRTDTPVNWDKELENLQSVQAAAIRDTTGVQPTQV